MSKIVAYCTNLKFSSNNIRRLAPLGVVHDLANHQDRRAEHHPDEEQFPKEPEPSVEGDTDDAQVTHGYRGMRQNVVTETVTKFESQYSCLSGDAGHVSQRHHDRHGQSGLSGTRGYKDVDNHMGNHHTRSSQDAGQGVQYDGGSVYNGIQYVALGKYQSHGGTKSDYEGGAYHTLTALYKGRGNLAGGFAIQETSDEAHVDKDNSHLIQIPGKVDTAVDDEAEATQYSQHNGEMLLLDLYVSAIGGNLVGEFLAIDIAFGGILFNLPAVTHNENGVYNKEEYKGNNTHGNTGKDWQPGDFLGNSGGALQHAGTEAGSYAQQDNGDADDGVKAQGGGEQYAYRRKGDKPVRRLGQANAEIRIPAEIRESAERPGWRTSGTGRSDRPGTHWNAG